ncbi:MAG TPA: AAA family ATPase [Candidatus Tumulicola sp.]
MARRPQRVGDHPHTDAHGEVRFRLLGHVGVDVAGEPFKLATPRKTLPILAYLLLNREAPVARDFLAYVMWPDDEEESARNKLRMSLYDLARILPADLGEGALAVDGDSVQLRPSLNLWLDVDEFDRLIRDPERTEEAIALYRGDLLASLYDEWIIPERERRRNAFLGALANLVSRARRQRHFRSGITRARQILAMDPWREDIVRQLIALRSESGDRAGALAEYEGFAQRLKAELHVEPMPETVTLKEAIAAGTSLEADPPFETVETVFSSRPPILPFVGRHAEMGRLLEAWSRAARGRGTCVFVGGEAGIGKSRLVREFAHSVEDRGGRVLFGATGAPETAAYESIVDALHSALPLVASLRSDMWLAAVAALLPEIRARVTKLPELPALDAESERIRLFEALNRCLAGLAAPRPLLLVLEDLHWAQSASIALLDFLVRHVAAVPMMIVATYRDDETPRPHPLHRLHRETRATGSAQSLSLRAFSLGDVREAIETLPEVRDCPPASLLDASDGNPLFLTQLVADFREGSDIAEAASLRAVVSRRIERLSPEARTIAEIAAEIGPRFSRDAVREVSGWSDGAVVAALDELLDRRIIREASGRGLFEYEFSHQAVCEAIVAAAPPERAAARRHRVARVLEELYADRAPELSALIARQYELAGDDANAGRCYLAAIRRSLALGALDEAQQLRDRALALDTDERRRVDLLLDSATIEFRRGDRGAWNATLSELSRLAAGLDDEELQRVILMRRIEFALSIGDRVTHEAAIRELRMRTPEGHAHWRGLLHAAEAKLAFSLGRLGESYDAAEIALACARECQNGTGVADALCCLANVESHRGRLAEADALFDEAARTAADATDPVLELQSFWSAWAIAYQRRDIPRCLTVGERWLERAIALGDRPSEAQAHGRLGVALGAAGERYALARAHFAEAAAIFGESGNVSGTAGELLNQSLVFTRLGFFHEAVAATDKAVALFESVKDGRGRVIGLANLAFLRACTRDVAGAKEAGKKAISLARKHEFKLIEASAIENLAFAEAAGGNLVRAIQHANEALDLRQHSQSEVWSCKMLADLAVWHAALGDLTAARDSVRRMLANENAILRGTDWPEYCYWAAAQIFHLDGNANEAQFALGQARRMIDATAAELEPEDRDQFATIPWHVDIANAATNDVWPVPPR